MEHFGIISPKYSMCRKHAMSIQKGLINTGLKKAIVDVSSFNILFLNWCSYLYFRPINMKRAISYNKNKTCSRLHVSAHSVKRLEVV
jgi:hypothetical protein